MARARISARRVGDQASPLKESLGILEVVIRDNCDPATFNAVVGPGTCVADGSTTFSEFVDQLIAQGRAPAWRFALDHLSLAAGGTLVDATSAARPIRSPMSRTSEAGASAS